MHFIGKIHEEDQDPVLPFRPHARSHILRKNGAGARASGIPIAAKICTDFFVHPGHQEGMRGGVFDAIPGNMGGERTGRGEDQIMVVCSRHRNGGEKQNKDHGQDKRALSDKNPHSSWDCICTL
ncbi:MAG: hypothetical protein BWY93_01394 [Euryarchaeota archaeon ADurb.BinA087]|nr:MAG: hypothetical protein BWY93_01394 [Euryarchaeota archaeon ADurb.BinA087]